MKQIIVTGATGFIGSAFVKFLTGKGVDVIALGRKAFNSLPPHILKNLSGSTYLQIPMQEIATLPHRLEKINWNVKQNCVFFNLAWGGLSTLSDLNVEAQIKNVHWSTNALKVACELKCDKFIQIGTMEEAFTNRYLELDHNINSEYNRHLVYSIAKISAKNSIQLKAKKLDIDCNYVLHSHVMGPFDNKDSFLQVTLQKLISKDELIFSSGEQLFDVISLEDCCLGYYLICLYGTPSTEYWVGSGNPKPLREYVERMYSLFPSGKEMKFGKLPYNDIKLTAKDFSISSLVNDTGFEPQLSFEQTVQSLHKHLLKR